MSAPTFQQDITGNIDWSSMYTSAAAEVNSKLNEAKQQGIAGILSQTGGNQDELNADATQAERQGLAGPIATALEANHRSRMAGATASKIAGNEVGYTNKESDTTMGGALGALKAKEAQQQSIQEMTGNIIGGLGGAVGTLFGKLKPGVKTATGGIADVPVYDESAMPMEGTADYEATVPQAIGPVNLGG